MDLLAIIEQRHSSRVPFDPERRIPEQDLRHILQAARWAPTPHNMQNFELVLVDDREILQSLALIETEVSQVFVEESYEHLSFTEEELRQRKVGLLGSPFPPAWRSRGTPPRVVQDPTHSILGEAILASAAVVVVLYDSRRHAPASAGDLLGFMSLGCVMENMWLVAQSLGIGFQVQSVLGSERVERDVQRTLQIPEHMRVGFGVRLGYPRDAPAPAPVRVRRGIEDFTHRNRFRDHRPVR